VAKTKATDSHRRITWGRYLLVLFVAAWMFILGVLVGRGTAPVHFDTQALQKELAALRDTMMKKEREAVEKAIRGEDAKAPLEFYEALKKNGPDTTVHIPVDDAFTTRRSNGKASAKEMKPPHKSRPTIKVKKSPVRLTPKLSDRLPPNDLKAGSLTIQVASMKDSTAAQRIVANLKKEGYPAYLSRFHIIDQGTWFRVRVGSYKDREQAATVMKRLTRDQKKPILVKK
jgi:cell division septation protein DedD